MAESNSPTFDLRSAGCAAVSGTLSFATAGRLLAQGARCIGAGEADNIDLAGVKGTDSAGLALLVEWLSIAKTAGRVLRYENIPSQLLQLAKLSDVDGLLSGAKEA